MCENRDSIDAVTSAAERLERACQTKGRRACDQILRDPATLPHLPKPASDLDSLLRQAEAALAEAKNHHLKAPRGPRGH